MSTAKERERDEAIAELRKALKPGTTVYTVLRHVSSSGMTRDIDLYVMQDNEPRYISYLAAKALGYRMSPGSGEGVRVSGAGMDMGFHVVYSLSRTVFANGHKCLGKGTKRRNYRDACPSNDHSNDYNAFSRAYDEEHAPQDESKWYVSAQSTLGGFGFEMSAEQREERAAYQTAKSLAWEQGEADRWSRKRQHRDGGYVLRHRWM